MSYTIRSAQAADWPAIADLLTRAELPLAGAQEHLRNFIIAEADGEVVGTAGMVVGTAGIEAYGSAGLLRSLAVDPRQRGQGVGEALVNQVLAEAANDGITEVALLTTTAPDYFPRFGFEQVERSALPAQLTESAEFQGACPASAVAMLRQR